MPKMSPDKDPDWQKVKRTVSPLKRGSSQPIAPSRSNYMRVALDPKIKTDRRTHPPKLNLDKKTRRGRLDIGARIDLHDKTLDQAYPVLIEAVRRAADKDVKVLLVITGKGPRLEGKIRQSFPLWLQSSHIRPYIASYAQAHIKHGGTGAWYVFLRRNSGL